MERIICSSFVKGNLISEPYKFIDEIANAGTSIITFHYKTGKDVYKIIQMVRRYKDVKVGIALRPYTHLDLIIPFIESLDMILLMSYSSGIFNQKIVPNFEKRIKKARDLAVKFDRENIDIAIDGGITLDNLKKYKKS